MIRFLIIIVVLINGLTVYAQTASDALRYSALEVRGTARTLGIGGAMGAIGADFSVMSTNPAGLSRYRTSELVITPSFFSTKTTSLLVGNDNNVSTSEKDSKFDLNNLGIVMGSQPVDSKWKTVNVAIGFNRLASYNQETFFEGLSKGSYTDRFVELANGNDPSQLDDFEAGLAYDAEAIFNPTSDLSFYDNDFTPDQEIKKQQSIRSKGSINELGFSLAGNLDEKLMIGVTVGLPFINFEETKTYLEDDTEKDEIPIFNRMEYIESLSTSGIGLNLKLGMIYHIKQTVRLGFAVHTPTRMKLTDNYYNIINYDLNFNGDNYYNEERTPDGVFDYKLSTPWRATLSSGFIIARKGFIGAELEYIDYSIADFNLTENSTAAEDKQYELEVNEEINDDFQSTVNLRIGGEYALSIYRFRLGYNLLGNPYTEGNSLNSAYSAGVGIREKTFFIDLAYRFEDREEAYSPYRLFDSARQQSVQTNSTRSNFILTLGFKF